MHIFKKIVLNTILKSINYSSQICYKMDYCSGQNGFSMLKLSHLCLKKST